MCQQNNIIEINELTDFNKLDFSKTAKYCVVFFHYDKSKILEDHNFVKQFEDKYNYYVNWIDISDLFNNYKSLQNKFLKNYSDLNEDKEILNYIKQYVYKCIKKLRRSKNDESS